MYNQELISSWYNLWHNIGSSRLKHVYWFRTVQSSFFIVWILYACSIRSSLSIGVDQIFCEHYSDVIMGTIASQITSFTIVYSTVYSDADQRKHQSSASLAFVRGIHRGPVNSPHKWPVTRKMMTSSWSESEPVGCYTTYKTTRSITGQLSGTCKHIWQRSPSEIGFQSNHLWIN